MMICDDADLLLASAYKEEFPTSNLGQAAIEADPTIQQHPAEQEDVARGKKLQEVIAVHKEEEASMADQDQGESVVVAQPDTLGTTIDPPAGEQEGAHGLDPTSPPRVSALCRFGFA